MRPITSVAGSSAGRFVPQARFARLWKAVVSGVVSSRANDVEDWYRITHHVLTVALHEAQLDRVLDDATDGAAPPETPHAA